MISHQQGVFVPNGPRENKRRYGRVRCDGYVGTLGPVLDVSRGGVKMRARWRRPRVGRVMDLVVSCHSGDVPIVARVVRVTRRGFLSYEVALEFVSMSEQACGTLLEIVRAAQPTVTATRDVA